jgi:hypothetical protein
MNKHSARGKSLKDGLMQARIRSFIVARRTLASLGGERRLRI